MDVKRALVSISNKEGLVDFCRELKKLGVEIISSRGTAQVLKENGLEVTPVSELTKSPEMLDGRVKTLHPAIHAAILAVRENKEHMEELEKQGIKPIDMVVVNLYPFEERLEEGTTLDELIENIDIGGPALVRSAAKNYKNVVVITDPNQYSNVLKELSNKKVSIKTRELLATKAFEYVASYDIAIENYFKDKFTNDLFPDKLNLSFNKIQDLKYGENYHQKGALYTKHLTQNFKQIQGETLSFNNILDLNDAWNVANAFEKSTAAIIKHTNPAGVSCADTLVEAYKTAFEADSISAFGSVVGLNREVDAKTAEELSKTFIEAIVAPSYEKGALEILKKKKKLILIKAKVEYKQETNIGIRSVNSGLVVQTPNLTKLSRNDLKVVSKKEPLEEDIETMLFAWEIVKHVKSNAIVLAKGKNTVGIGAGQMSRVDATKIATEKAGKNAKNSIMASDAFIPFRDAIDEAAKAGIAGIIQPGGSIRDKEMIEAVNEHKMSMVFTGQRCFKH